MSVKMGLYGVNKADPLKQRTARQGVLTYAQISQRARGAGRAEFTLPRAG